MTFGLKGVLTLAALGLAVQIQAAPATSAKSKPKTGAATGTVVAPTVKAPVAGSARVSVSTPSAMMAVPGSTTAPSAAAGVSGISAHGGSELDMTGAADLTAAQSASLRAELSTGVLSELNSAQAALLNTVTIVNADQEAALDKFVTQTVPAWACGDACANTVIDVLNTSTAYATEVIQVGQDIEVGGAFSYGLNANGILGAAQQSCPAELGSLIGG